MNEASRRESGQTAEDTARRHLEAQGLRLLDRNVRARRGEIDLVMEDGDVLVFVEVRYRGDPAHGSALESIGATKQRRLIHAASTYLQRHRLDRPCRFDVVAITGETLEWVANAFDAT
ncbi:YraN family protein [Aquisalimonas sp.]|uniref:YraN family protein n=1 Tax=unclassified Aquisalimonas TaxID=2644645 RepID=UPI0025BAE105|nr:YraN family protein [Aquisalimonas sp.]